MTVALQHKSLTLILKPDPNHNSNHNTNPHVSLLQSSLYLQVTSTFYHSTPNSRSSLDRHFTRDHPTEPLPHYFSKYNTANEIQLFTNHNELIANSNDTDTHWIQKQGNITALPCFCIGISSFKTTVSIIAHSHRTTTKRQRTLILLNVEMGNSPDIL